MQQLAHHYYFLFFSSDVGLQLEIAPFSILKGLKNKSFEIFPTVFVSK